MDLLRRLGGISALTRFGLISLLLTVAVGLVLAHVLRDTVTERARQQAEQGVVVTVRLGLQPQVDAADFADGFDPARLAHVEEALHGAARGDHTAGLDSMDPVRIKMFGRDGTIVYSDQTDLIGRQVDSPDVRRALAGEVLSKFTTLDLEEERGSAEHQLLEVYVPVQFDGRSSPDGVVEVYLPYGPVAAGVAEDIRTLTYALVVSLTCFYCILFRFMARVSRRLRQQTAELQDSSDRNHHQATHDALTGLPNRVLLLDRLERALAGAARTAGQVAVMLIDLDRFKEINDTLGHSYGDRLLRQVGPRLQSVLRDADTVARLGGDEFAVLLPVVESPDEAKAVADRLREALHRSFHVDGLALDIEASIGISLSPWHGLDTEALLSHADTAMYVAKELKAGAVVFDPDEHGAAPLRLTLLGDLRRALESEDELFLHYQPKYRLDGGALTGVEALLRWRHPERGLVPPDEFIPLAEGTGIIFDVTERVLDLALRQARGWLDQGHPVAIAVNLSTRCLLDAELPHLVRGLLVEHGVPEGLLRLEVTESAVMADAPRCLEVLQRLHDLGVQISIDDFGTGYTSMAHLRHLPIDELKVDRSFVMGMTDTEQDAVLVRTAIDLGHNLGLVVVAEGVEGAAHLAALQELGCDVAQGYHLARPMPAEDVTALLGAAAGEPATVGH